MIKRDIERLIVKRSNYLGFATLQFWQKETDRKPVFAIGVKKAQIIVGRIADIEAFLQDNPNAPQHTKP